MGESKRELAIRMLKENACMFNSCLAKDELKHFKNYDFVQYLINRLSIPEHNYDNCHNATCKRKSRKDGYKQGVDDFAEKLNEKCDGMIKDKWNSNVAPISWAEAYADFKDDINDIAEQLKAGRENENYNKE